MGWLSLASALLPSLFKTVDKVVDNKAEAEQLKLQLQKDILSGEMKELESATKVLVAEMSGSWLQRNWRPMVMVNFMVLINAYWCGFVPDNLTPEALSAIFELVKWGLGGYVIGRSGEKIVKTWKNS